jgi:hypothetical protein
MKIGEVKAAYEALSGKASDIVRQLSLGGIALLWLFRIGTERIFTLDQHLLRAAFFIFLALILDFLQYLIATTTWFVYFRYKEKQKIGENDTFLAPTQLNWAGWCLFYLKSTSILIAYAGFIIPFLMQKFVA